MSRAARAASAPVAPDARRPSPVPLLGAAVALMVVLVGGELGTPLTGQVAALAWLGVVALLSARNLPLGVLSPFPVFVGGAIAYTLPVAATLAVAGALFDERAVGDASLTRGAVVSTEALIAAVGGYGLAALFPGRRAKPWGRLVRWWAPTAVSLTAGAAGAVGAAGALVFVFAVAGLGTLRSASYGDRYLLMAGQGALLLGVQTFVVAAIVLLAHAVYRKRAGAALALTIVTGAGLFAWTGLIGSRSALIAFVLGAAVVRHTLSRRLPFAALTLGAVAILVVSSLFSLVRAGISWSDVLGSVEIARLNPANSELGAAAATVGDVTGAIPREEPYRLGATYVEALGVLVPQFLWPGRPLGAGEWYAQRFYPMFAEAGGAYAFSPVAEAYLNFGRVGVAVVFVLLGAALARLERKFAAEPRLPLWTSITYAVGLPWLLLFSRLDFATLIKSGLLFTFGQLAAMYALARVVAFIAAPLPAGPSIASTATQPAAR